jgi:hypothetical protein
VRAMIKNWHPGKIILLWGIAAFIWWIDDEGYRDVPEFVWQASIVVCAAATWVWLSGRERK